MSITGLQVVKPDLTLLSNPNLWIVQARPIDSQTESIAPRASPYKLRPRPTDCCAVRPTPLYNSQNPASEHHGATVECHGKTATSGQGVRNIQRRTMH